MKTRYLVARAFFVISMLALVLFGVSNDVEVGAGVSVPGAGSTTLGFKIGLPDRATLFGRASTFKTKGYKDIGRKYLGLDYTFIGVGVQITNPIGYLGQSRYLNWMMTPVHERMPQNFQLIDRW